MLKRHSQVLISALMICDLMVICLTWVGAFKIRFSEIFIALNIGNDDVPKIQAYLFLLLIIAPASLLTNRASHLYEPQRIASFRKEFTGILRSTLLIVLVFLAVAFFIRPDDISFLGVEKIRFSRTFIVMFAFIHVSVMIVERYIIRRTLRRLRSQGKNIRRALVIGAGKNGQALANAIDRNAWTGIQVKGFLDDRDERQGLDIRGANVLGKCEDVLATIKAQNIDQVYIALPASAQELVTNLLNQLAEETVDVLLVPDVLSFTSLKLEMSNFDGLPLINLRDNPLYGWSAIIKRGFDITFSATALLFLSIPMIIVAILVKLGSKGPIFYGQERMGLDGRTFTMWKFRSMKTDAEIESGAVWAKENDPRRTALGTFLRKSSLDELPQFFNVLLGHMSVVGPRPERPVFIDEFKSTVPKYMLRHKMKSGITGWAQVNGWRGNTSLKKRIQCDVYYIEHWSFAFDLYIILLTVYQVIKPKNAY